MFKARLTEFNRAVKVLDEPKGYLCEISNNVWKHVNNYGEIKNHSISFDNTKILELINEKKVEIVPQESPIKFDVINSIDSTWMDHE